MRILILGKNGMLGRDLMDVFSKDDFIALGKEDLDITDRDRVFEKFMTIQPDVVINATGYTNVNKAESEPESANDINGYAVGVLAQGCREIDATFVHFSTDYVFKGIKKSGYNEEDMPDPINAYGKSKALGEHLMMEEMEMLNGEKAKEGKYFLIRTSWLFGRHGKNFVETMLDLGRKNSQLKGGEDVLKVINDQFGKPTYSMDLARQVGWLLKSRDYPSGIYHITNECTTTWYDFAVEIFRLAKINIDVIPCATTEYPSPAKRPHYSALNNNILPPLRPWKEALAEYLSINTLL